MEEPALLGYPQRDVDVGRGDDADDVALPNGTEIAVQGIGRADARRRSRNARGDIVGTTRSDADGYYRLADLAPGTPVKVVVHHVDGTADEEPRLRQERSKARQELETEAR